MINRGLRPGELSFFAAVSLLLGRRRLVLGYPLAASVAAVALTYLVDPSYVASVSFVPEHRSTSALPPGLTGLASQFGVSLPTNVTNSPAFYVSVLESRGLTGQVLLSRFPDPKRPAGDSLPLLTLIGAEGRTQAESVDVGMKRLRRLVRTKADPRSGIIQLSVRTKFPALSAAVATAFVEHLNRFNTVHRQSQAGQRRKFIESRVADVARNLREAEGSLTQFYEANRSWLQSPKLVVQEGRLRREIDVVRDLYLTLEREYELSRIEEVNDTPVLTVVDPAIPPVRRSSPQRAKIGVGVWVVGMLLGAFAALVGDYLDRLRAQDPDQFARLKELLRPWRRGLKGSRPGSTDG